MRISKRVVLCSLSILLITVGCSSNKKRENPSVIVTDYSMLDMPETSVLNLNKVDIPLFKLKGEHQMLEEEFIEMNGYTWLQRYGDYLIFLNANFRQDYICLVYTFPDLKFHKKFLKYGYGPDEFSRVSIGFFDEPTANGAIGYVFENALGYYYEIDGNFELIRKIKYKELEGKLLEARFLPELTALHSQGGVHLYKYDAQSNFPGTPFLDLQILPEVTFPYAYRMDYAMNQKHNRMMLCYMFFNEIHVYDMQGNLLRKTVGADKNRHVKSNKSSDWMDNMDRNCYYNRCFGTDNYFYTFYMSEGTLGERVRGVSSRTVIRKFDWNGTPVCDFELDKTISSNGEFYVDEQNKKIYVLASQEDDPLYIYAYD